MILFGPCDIYKLLNVVVSRNSVEHHTALRRNIENVDYLSKALAVRKAIFSFEVFEDQIVGT